MPGLVPCIAEDQMRFTTAGDQRAALKKSAFVLLLRWLEDPDAPDTVACKYGPLRVTPI